MMAECIIYTRTYVDKNVNGTVLLDLNFTYACTQKATACNIHGNAPE